MGGGDLIKSSLLHPHWYPSFLFCRGVCDSQLIFLNSSMCYISSFSSLYLPFTCLFNIILMQILL